MQKFILVLPFPIVVFSILIVLNLERIFAIFPPARYVFAIFPPSFVALGSATFLALADGVTGFLVFTLPALVAWVAAIVWRRWQYSLSILGWIFES